MLLYILLKYNPLNQDWPVLLVLAVMFVIALIKIIKIVFKEKEEKIVPIDYNSALSISEFSEPELIAVNYDSCKFDEITLDTAATEASETTYFIISYLTFNYSNDQNNEVFKSQNFYMDVESLKTHVWLKRVNLLVDSNDRSKYTFIILNE